MVARIVCRVVILASTVSLIPQDRFNYFFWEAEANDGTELDLPEYETYEDLRKALYTAMTAGGEYFGFA